MKAYTLTANERAQTGFTDLFVVKAADMTSFSAFQIVLTALAVGDVVYPQVLMETKTYVTGPSGAPTASVGIVGTVARFTAASAVASGSKYVAPATTVAPLANNTAVNMILDLQVGGGDGAAATAGEIWVWAKICRVGERAVKG